MIQGFDVKDVALGTGDTLTYTFDFKIYELTDLLIWVQDGSGNIVEEIRGDDQTFLAGVTFDSINGGGTVTLVSFLPDTYVMTMLLAIDDPDQPTSFTSQRSFTLGVFEGALDLLVSYIQRVAYLAQRAMVLHDLDDIDLFDPTLPQGIGNTPGGVVSVKQDGSGFECVLSVNSLAQAQANASAGLPVSYGSAAAPLPIQAGIGVSFHQNINEVQFVKGSGGPVTVSANPQISAGSVVGQRLTLVGKDATNTVGLANGNGLSLSASMTLGLNNILQLLWDGSTWLEVSRR